MTNDDVAKGCGWTPIKDGLPKKDWTDCFVMTPDMFNRYNVVRVTFSSGHFFRKIRDYEKVMDIAVVVDYWMEIPQVPEYPDEMA